MIRYNLSFLNVWIISKSIKVNFEELENKFKNLVSPVLGPARAATIIEVVNNLEEIKFISKLTQLFRATSTETHSEMIMD